MVRELDWLDDKLDIAPECLLVCLGFGTDSILPLSKLRVLGPKYLHDHDAISSSSSGNSQVASYIDRWIDI